MSNLNLPGYDRWLDSPYQREMDARVDVEDEDDVDTLDLDELRADLDLDGVDD